MQSSTSRSPFTQSRVVLASLIGATALALACSKPAQSPPAESAEAESSAPAGPAAGKRKNFHDMTPNEKGAYMKEVVVPDMKALWESAGQKVDTFNCKTCHGAGVDNGSFKMPNDSLPKLDVSDGFADEKKEHPAAVQFMMEKVVPQMAALIDEEPYNPETHQGFGCFGCHVKAEPSPAAAP